MTTEAEVTCQSSDKEPSIKADTTNNSSQSPTPNGEIHADSDQNSIDWGYLDFDNSEIFLNDPNLTVASLPHTHLEPAAAFIPDTPPLGTSNIEASDAGHSNFTSSNKLLFNQMLRSGQTSSDNVKFALAGLQSDSEQPYHQLLARIPMRDPVSKFTANIVMQMLCAFPQMMLRRETFPPFIHGHWFCTSSDTTPSLPKPLVNCMGLAQIFASQNVDTRPFLWEKVGEEQRWIADKAYRQQFSKQDHLAAIQALLIYIMMRVIDCSKAELDLNLELLVTYQGLCESFKELCGEPFYKHERCCPSSSWEDWVFAESRRRTAIVWLLITQMVHIKIGVPCDSFSSFRDVPLSSPKSLWEAKTRSQWEKEYEVYKAMPGGGLNIFGDLYDACRQSHVDANQLKLHTWNATIDNLGSLLNLGAQII